MRTHVRKFLAKARAFKAQVAATTAPVWVFITIETAAAACLVTVAYRHVTEAAASVELDGSPPWRALVVFPLAGAALALVHRRRPAETFWRWHGVVVRRVDWYGTADGRSDLAHSLARRVRRLGSTLTVTARRLASRFPGGERR